MTELANLNKVLSTKAKFIFITGGVVSSLGKGLASASLASILQARGFKVRLRKLDPYLNVDPGTMSPYQHGEVFVTDDGTEADLDLGHYERFSGVPAKSTDSVTTGKIYQRVIDKERHGDYLGATIQVIPHVTNEIKDFIYSDVSDEDFVLCEIGGTVGDIEGQPYLEAIRQVAYDLGRDRVMFIHVTLLPYIPTAGELKTKPTQHSVKKLQEYGIQPDMLLCRSQTPIPQNEKRKIALFCNIREDNVIAALDVDTIYQVPVAYSHEGMDTQVCKHFGLDCGKEPDLSKWENIVNTIRCPEGEVKIAVVGKYTQLLEAYKSLNEALTHGGIANKFKVRIKWIDSELLEQEDPATYLAEVNGILVPGGFGERGTEGKMLAIKYAREHKVPFLGICLGEHLLFAEGTEGAVSAHVGTVDSNSSDSADETSATCEGLAVLPGTVDRIPEYDEQGRRFKVPHVGWNSVEFDPDTTCPLLRGIQSGEYFYFTHSYIAPQTQACVATTTHSVTFPCVVQKGDTVFGVQFHPEKSSDAGAKVMENFVRLADKNQAAL